MLIPGARADGQGARGELERMKDVMGTVRGAMRVAGDAVVGIGSLLPVTAFGGA